VALTGSPTLLDGIDDATIDGWIDNYCYGHQLASLSEATGALVKELLRYRPKKLKLGHYPRSDRTGTEQQVGPPGPVVVGCERPRAAGARADSTRRRRLFARRAKESVRE
jgi:hypothetical protein